MWFDKCMDISDDECICSVIVFCVMINDVCYVMHHGDCIWIVFDWCVIINACLDYDGECIVSVCIDAFLVMSDIECL